MFLERLSRVEPNESNQLFTVLESERFHEQRKRALDLCRVYILRTPLWDTQKDWEMAQQERGWWSVPGKYVCPECFEEEFLRQFVKDHAEVSKCDYCETTAEGLTGDETELIAQSTFRLLWLRKVVPKTDVSRNPGPCCPTNRAPQKPND